MAEHSGTNTLAFGHAQLARAVVKRIQRHFHTDATRRSAVEQSLVVGVFGEWGSGKSSLLHAVQQDFAEQPDANAPVVTVFFNAWRYEKEPHLIVPLLKTIQAEIQRAIPASSQENLPTTGQEDTSNTHLSLLERFKEKLSKGSQLFGNAAKAFAQVAHEATITFKQPGIPVEVSLKTSPKAAVELFRSSQDKKDEKKDNSAPDPSHYAKLDEYDTLYLEFERQLRELTEGEPALNLLFFIDDLDRCLPEKALEMLEAIKLFFDVPRCVFVLAVDDEVVERGVQHRYRDYLFEANKATNAHTHADASHRLPITGAEYLEKIIHLPLRLPPTQTGQAEQFLRERYPELFDHRASYREHQAFIQQANKEEEEARQKLKYRRDILNTNRQYRTQQEILAETSARDHAQQYLEHAQQQRDLCQLFVSAVPPVPRKLQRAAELFYMQLDASQQLGMGIDRQPSQVLLLARLAIWQCFAPELFRLCRRQPSRFLRIAQWFAAGQQDFCVINAEEHIEKDIYGESQGDALTELKNLRRCVAASRNQRSEFDLKTLFTPYPSDIIQNQNSIEHKNKPNILNWHHGDQLRKLAQFGIDIPIDETKLTAYDTTTTQPPNVTYGNVADPQEFINLLFSKNIVDQQDALTNRLQGGLLPSILFHQVLKDPKFYQQNPKWLGQLIKYLAPDDAEALPPILPELSAIQWHLRRPVFSPDGNTVLTPEQNGTAKLWNIHTGELIRSFNGHKDGIIRSAFSKNGDTILTASADKTVKLWDLNNGSLIHSFNDHAFHAAGCAFSIDESNIFTVDSKPGKIRTWDRKNGILLREISIGFSYITAHSFAPDRNAVLTTCHELIAKLWDIDTGKIIYELKGHTDAISDCAFSLDGKTILTVSYDSTAKLWDSLTGALLNSIEIYSPKYNLSCTSSPDGKKFITGHSIKNTESSESTEPSITCATLWDSKTGEPIFIFKHRGSDVFGAFSNNGTHIITTSIDNTARLWDSKTGELLKSLTPLYEKISNCIFSPTGDRILTADGTYSLMLWDVESGEFIRRYVDRDMKTNRHHCAFSPDGKSILINSSGNSEISSHASLWDVQTGKRNLLFFGHSGYIFDIDFSPNGKYILTASDDHSAKLFDSQSGEELQSYNDHSSRVLSCAFSHDSKLVLTGSDDNTAKLWNCLTGELIYTFQGHTNAVQDCKFSPNGQMVLTIGNDQTIRLWSTQTGAQLKIFKCETHPWHVRIAFSKNNRTIMFTENDYAVLLDIETGNILHRLPHAFWIYSCAFSPNGEYAVTGSADSTTKLWDVRTGTLLRTFFTSQAENLALSWPASPRDFINYGCILRKLNKNQDIDWEKPLNWIIQDKYLSERQPIRTWPLIKLIARYGDHASRELLPASARLTTETKKSEPSVWGWPPSIMINNIAKLR